MHVKSHTEITKRLLNNVWMQKNVQNGSIPLLCLNFNNLICKETNNIEIELEVVGVE